MAKRNLSIVSLLLVTFLMLSGNAAADTILGDVVISTNTTWAEDTYQLTSLTVNNGATISIAGGSTLNVSGAITVTAASTILLQGKNVSAQVNGQWVGTGVTITAASMQIDSGSAITADGQGYPTGNGPGAAVNSAGGSYGGRGTGVSAPTYGSTMGPIDLGSPGSGSPNGGWSKGGGAIRLVVSGTLTVDGSLSANGTRTEWSAGGSGGSIWATVGTLAGAGTISANGSIGGTSGGGGRVALYYTANTGFNLTKVIANSGLNGTVGTVYLLDNNANLYVTTNLYFPADTTLSYSNIALSNGAILTVGGGSNLTATNAFMVTGNSTVIVESKNNSGQIDGQWVGAGSTFTAGSMQIDSGSVITADGQGYTTGNGPGATAGNDANIGASYGGRGAGTSALTYGSNIGPIDLGSAGGSPNGGWSAGGGAMRLVVSGTLTVNGSLSANGTIGGQGWTGGSAGGSIWVTAGTLTGTGTISGNGSYGYTGGGGGRIAVYYIGGSGLNPLSIAAGGGGTGSGAGQPGSVIYSTTSQFLWIKPTQNLLHGTGHLQWTAFSIDMISTTVDVTASSRGMVYSLGTRLPCISGIDWDTTTVPDGLYELRLVFHGSDEHVLSEVPKTVLINNSVIWHTGAVAADETWTSNKVHVIEGVLFLPSGVHVTINPGTVVKVAAGAQIIVDTGGIFDAVGTAQAGITITTLEDDSFGGDTNLDGNQTKPVPGEWLGVTVQGAGQFNQSSYTDIRYAMSLRSGALSSSENWLGTYVYHVTGNIIVPNGVTLTIQPGTIIKFDPNTGINVQTGGSLVASGSVALPIYFTSIKDDSVGGNTTGEDKTSTPASGDWGYINVSVGGTASFNHATIRYGTGNVGMITSAGTVTVNNSIIMNATYDGINSTSGTVAITNSVISETDRAIMGHGGAVQVVNCTVDNNRRGIWGTVTIANSIVTNSTVDGISGDPPVRYSNIWNPQATSGNFSGVNQIGQNGNISVDPKYKNLSQKDYRLNYGSPSIDAADGTLAPVTDSMGAPRYDDPRTPNTGIATTVGAYADMGVYEFVENADSDLDLVAGSVSGPTAAIVGNQVQLSWTDTNIGQGQVVGPWHDAIYLVRDPDSNPMEIFAGEVLVGQNGTFGPGQSTSPTATITVPGSIVGNHRWKVRTNSRGEVFEGKNSGNNAALSTGMVAVDLKELSIDGPLLSGQFTTVGQPFWYKIIPGPGKEVGISLGLSGNAGTSQLYVGQGYLPDAQHFDFKQNEWNAANTSATIPNTSTQTYYVTAYAGSLPSSSAVFSISAKSVNFSVTAVQPGSVSNSGNVTFELSGGQLSFGAIYGLVGPNGTVYNPISVFLPNSPNAFVTFNLFGLATGSYGIQATQNGTTITDPNTINVTSSVYSPSQFEFDVIVPQAVRAGGQGQITVTYKNVSSTDAIAPLIWLDANRGATLEERGKHSQEAMPRIKLYSTGMMLGINREGPAGVLPPGASGSITYVMKPTVTSGEIDFSLKTIDRMAQLNWGSLRISTKPGFVEQAAWNAVFANMEASMGISMTQLNTALAADATYLSRLGIYENDPNTLFTFELMKAGLATIIPRWTKGAFGMGSTHAFDIWGAVEAGNIVLHYPVGTVRMLLLVPDPDTPNKYIGTPGDYGTLSVNSTDQSWLLREQNGTLFHFIVDPNNTSNHIIDYVQDLNGNQVNINYTGTLVTSVTNSTGDKLQYSYNGEGRIIQSIDPVGRVTTYSYDPNGQQQLISITNAAGTTSFTYITFSGTNAAQSNAVQSITYPDGTHFYFEYDPNGRLTKQYRDGGAETITYAYDSTGEISVIDALGNTSHILPTASGQIGQISNPLGAITRFSYDQEQNLTGIVAPQETTLSFGYDAQGNLNAAANPLGNQQGYQYGAYGTLTSLTDSLGNALQYAYDNQYNNNKIAYTDSSDEQAVYDLRGNLTKWTNRRGHFITYDYDTKNLITQKTYTDGSQVSYAYDSRRNLQTLTSAAGTINFTHDAADRLTGLFYPNGRSLQYTYDSGGRRTSMFDQSGFTVNYAYDAVGRLSQISDGSNAKIASYTYDSAGNISRKIMGNGTYITYVYDPAGNILQLVNHTANNVVISSHTYTYDLLGRKAGMTAPDGVYSYGYDAIGQLTSISLPSGGTIQYSYDAAGNRISTSASGVTTNYSVNGLNEYTSAGGTSFTYDDDGNLASKTGAGGAWNYVYDDENRLVGMTGPGVTLTYEYDSLGNRVAQTRNGQRTEFLIDPTGLGNVIAEYGDTGNLLTHYTYGIDLSSKVPSDGTASYYHFDGSSNTAQLTGVAGNVLNSYAFLPFGEKVSSSETISNPFTYVGQYGVRDEGNSLYFMRNRWYDPVLGRFTTPDPLGVNAGDANQYRYVSNGVPNSVDPMGLEDFGLLNSVDMYSKNKDLFVNGRENAHRHFGPINDIPNAKGNLPSNFLDTTQGGKLKNTFTEVGKNNGDSTEWNTIDDTIKFGIKVYKSPSFEQRKNVTRNSLNKQIDKIEKTFDKVLSDIYYYDWKVEQKLYDWGIWTPEKKKKVKIPTSSDPNLKTTVGYGTEGYVTADTPISYMVEFENQPSATAPAQKVVVTDQLSANLDWSTFQLSQIILNNTTIRIPAGLQSYTIRIAVPTDPNPVKVTAAFNPATGFVTWTMESIDPVTGGVPEDPYAGFLPPNNSTHRGEGLVYFTIKPKTGLAESATITNAATIVFDVNAPITTNTVINTIDLTKPTSNVTVLPGTTQTAAFTVAWGGSDPSGAGIAFYDVYVATDGGAYVLWLAGTTDTTATYNGTFGHTYAFYSVATDNVGHRQTTLGLVSSTSVTGTIPSLADAIKAFQNVYGLTTLTDTEKLRLDCAPLGSDGKPQPNGVVDTADVILLLRRIVGLVNW